MDKYMQVCLDEAKRGMENNEGGPFGAIIVKNGEIIAKAHNRVIKTNDPTAHAEIEAIREASRKLGRFDLSDCEIYSSCEPCPMCLSAIYWAKIKKLYFACTKEDAADIGFDDRYIYEVFEGKELEQRLEKIGLARKEALKIFEQWEKKQDKVNY